MISNASMIINTIMISNSIIMIINTDMTFLINPIGRIKKSSMKNKIATFINLT